jgi:hypothetical protein
LAHTRHARLRGWLLSLPAGIGFATLRAILKLWLGFPLNRSGVYSAGNGPAMRVAVIGAFFRRSETTGSLYRRLDPHHPYRSQGADRRRNRYCRTGGLDRPRFVDRAPAAGTVPRPAPRLWPE